MAARLGNINTVTLLFGKNRATPEAITNAFEKAGSLAVFKFVSARFHVSDNAIIAAFKHAAQYGTTAETIKTFSHEISQECIKIMNSLYMKRCIPSQAMSDAFAWAAFKQPIEVATAMSTNHRSVLPVGIQEFRRRSRRRFSVACC
ncbi:hypothetical protein JG687_00007664 [Phytophthora cactorum]|uniref:Uncharacterized protein n=1 Tax=Phytophthora cactorum TaxID=29920 RepID=A0A8T1UEH9_9STRA|nr:hypothetical protein JG687_00007664 [Phytophthora cactorum]